MVEIWKDIEGYEGLYQVSNTGKVKSLFYVNKNLKRTERVNHIIRKANPNADGYLELSMCINGKERKISIHRLVALAFIPNPENKETVNHIDGIKLNNRIDNLEWATRSENVKHAYRTGLKHQLSGNDSPKATIPADIREQIKKCTLSDHFASKKFGIHRGTIKNIRRHIL